jgi:hypothetical protein
MACAGLGGGEGMHFSHLKRFRIFLHTDLAHDAAAVLDDAARVGCLGQGTLCSFLLELAYNLPHGHVGFTSLYIRFT